MKPWIFAAAIVAALAGSAAAQNPPNYTFETVEDVQLVDDYSLRITGILLGEQTARRVEINTGMKVLLTSCERMALMSLARPGRYLLLAEFAMEFDMYYRCRLSQRR